MRVYLVLICVTLCVASFGRSDSAAPKDPFYGISPQDESYYKTSSDTIKCRDGSKKFSKSQLNDDFCDCLDGTDEPGTSACPTGRFYCRNAGHLPHTLFASRVNDGICDCCDGSDEYDGQVKCPNTCWEAGKAAREKLKKKIATYQDGVTLRKKEVEQARITLEKDEEELTKLKSEEKILKGLVEQLKERKEQIEKVEEKERLQKEKVEKEKKEAEEALRKESEPAEPKVETSEVEQNTDSEDKSTESIHDEVIGTLDPDPSNEDVNENHAAAEVESHDTSELEEPPPGGVEQHAEESKEKPVPEKHEDDSTTVPKDGNDGSENTEELSREELGRRIASRWTGEKHDDAKDNSDEGHGETPEQTHDEVYDGYAPDTDDEADKYDDSGKYDDVDDDVDETYEEDSHDDHKTSYQSDADDEFSDTSTTSLGTPSWLEKIQQAVRNILQVVNVFQTPVNISDAAYVRKEYDESSDKLSKLQSRISTLTKKQKLDFGPEKEFFSFYNRCFEGKENKYTYKVCPYKQASQVEGHSTTRLGNWDKFEDSYRTMLFSNGDHCWNGPDRSLKVRLRCGLKNEITDVDEPSRCEYVAILSTPALCTEEKLKELQNKLASMNEEQPEKHDEL